MTGSVAITGCAMAAANGFDTATVAGAVRTGVQALSTFTSGSHFFSPLITAKVPDACLEPIHREIPDAQGFTDQEVRLIQLAGILKDELHKTVGSEPIPWIIGLPHTLRRPEDVFGSLSVQLELDRDESGSGFIVQGRAAGLFALHQGTRMITSGQADQVLVGGIDTYNDLDILGMLNTELRIRTDLSPDHFVPGEGACLLLLSSDRFVRAHRPEVLCRVTATAEGFEPGHLYSKEPSRGQGLSSTFKDLFQVVPAGTGSITTIYSTMNGESVWAKEWGMAFIRHRSRFDESALMHHPAEFYGDPGAAAGPLMAGIALTGLRRGYLNGPVLVYASSDHGQRAAALLDRPLPTDNST